jgi:type IV secretion system protein VirB10
MNGSTAQSSADETPALIIDSGASRSWSEELANAGTGATATNAQVTSSHRSTKESILPIGTSIPAVLETAIDSARPGLVRAIVARDTRGADEQRILVPRGSRLFGEYDSASARAQKRVMIKWSKLVLPSGAVIELDSPATDWTGATGIPGRISGNGISRFVGSALQTALNIGANLIARTNTNTIVIAPATTSAYQSAQSLAPPAGSQGQGPRITVKAGALVNALVARDIDFSTLRRDR